MEGLSPYNYIIISELTSHKKTRIKEICKNSFCKNWGNLQKFKNSLCKNAKLQKSQFCNSAFESLIFEFYNFAIFSQFCNLALSILAFQDFRSSVDEGRARGRGVGYLKPCEETPHPSAAYARKNHFWTLRDGRPQATDRRNPSSVDEGRARGRGVGYLKPCEENKHPPAVYASRPFLGLCDKLGALSGWPSRARRARGPSEREGRLGSEATQSGRARNGPPARRAREGHPERAPSLSQSPKNGRLAAPKITSGPPRNVCRVFSLTPLASKTGRP